MNITVDAGDLARTIATLNHLPRGIRQKAIRIGMNAAGGLLRRDLELRSPVRYGYLEKSYGVKVVQKHRTKDWHLTVGARRKAVWTRRGKPVKPARYLHLANNGTVRSRGKHFVQRALVSSGAPAIAKATARISLEVQRLALANLKT